MVIGRGLCALRFSEADRRFAWHAVKSSIRALNRVAQGSTFVAVSRQDVERLTIPWHDTANQSIAAVLDTLDEAIANAEAMVAKLKQVRAGLLHDLLTRGLDEHGQLRDSLIHPEQFQDSPLGQIPRDWVFELLGERLQQNSGFIQTGPFGSQLHAHEYTAEGVPIVMPQDVLDGAVDTSQIARIPMARAEELKRHRIRLGDVIFARRGDLSRCAALAGRENGWLCGTGCLLMRFRESTLLPSWLSLAYRHDIGQRQVAARAVGTTMVNLNTKVLIQLRFAFPPKDEQVESVRRIAEADEAIRRESVSLSKIGHIKSGLMTDLLTGRVRMPADFKGNAAS